MYTKIVRELLHNSVSLCSGLIINAPFDQTDLVLDRLKLLYENCSLIDGNLEITDLTELDLKIAGGREKALKFLASIEEVYGYVLIANNQISNLSLPNLHTIWGDTLYSAQFDSETDNNRFSLVVTNNTLEILDFRNLRMINNGNVGIYNNPSICHWQTIDFGYILGSNNKSYERLKIGTNFALCTENEVSKCSNQCQQCFGPESVHCQQSFRKNCGLQCKSNLCFNVSPTLFPLNFCCHSECLGGCYGPLATQCYACKNMRLGRECVEKCPPTEIYNLLQMEFEPNPQGAYSFHRICVKKCPSYTLQYRDSCVYSCPKYFEADSSGRCNRCWNNCHRTCSINEILTIRNIDSLENCTMVDGFIAITSITFKSLTANNHNDITPMKYLNMLSKIEYVSDFVLIESEYENLKSLNFLQSLRTVKGRRLYKNQYSLVIKNNPGLEYLGLKNLDVISNGSLLIKGNNDLCYIQSLPWNEKIAKFSKLEIETTSCKNECHNACQEAKGCWGPGADFCYECKTWRFLDVCVENCSFEYGYFNASDKICQKCHSECLTCKGPALFDCLSCKTAVFNGQCVANCPNDHYLNVTSKVCTKCHENCFEFGCSGPDNFVGVGGCNRCIYGIQDLEKDIKVCLKCLEVCQSCQRFGKYELRDGCTCKSHRVLPPSGRAVYCSFECPQNYYNISSMNNSALTDCYPCHEQCNGCVGPLLSDCLDCKMYKNYLFDNTKKFVCTNVCPNDRQFITSEKICTNIDTAESTLSTVITVTLAQFSVQNSMSNYFVMNVISSCSLAVKLTRWPKVSSSIIAAISVAVIVSITAVFFLVVAAKCRRRGNRRFRAKLSHANEYFELNTNAKPDLSRLRLIVESELKRGSVLGYGAFGTVYKGLWQPKEIVESSNRKIPVAIKVLHESRNASAQQEMLEEAGHMARVRHPHLVSLVGVCLCQEMMLVTPLMPLGNLLGYVQNQRSKISASALLCWCAQIASGMSYLENLRLVHRDLAARNVLLQNSNHVRITDFGLAKMLDYGEEELRVEKGLLPLKWLALECIKSRSFTHKSDVWAYGVTLWELLTFGDEPYKNVPLPEIPKFLENGQRLPKPNVCSEEFYNILLKCWLPDAHDRPTFQELHAEFLQISVDNIIYVPQAKNDCREHSLVNYENVIKNDFENDSYQYYSPPEKQPITYAKIENQQNYFKHFKFANIFKHRKPDKYTKTADHEHGKELETLFANHTYYNDKLINNSSLEDQVNIVDKMLQESSNDFQSNMYYITASSLETP